MNLAEKQIVAGTLPQATARMGDTPSLGDAGSRDHDRAAGLIEPTWLAGGEGAPTGEVARSSLARVPREGSVGEHRPPPGLGTGTAGDGWRGPRRLCSLGWGAWGGRVAHLPGRAASQGHPHASLPGPALEGDPEGAQPRGQPSAGRQRAGAAGGLRRRRDPAPFRRGCGLCVDRRPPARLTPLGCPGRGRPGARCGNLSAQAPAALVDRLPRGPRGLLEEVLQQDPEYLARKSNKIEGTVIRFTEKREVPTFLEKSHHVSLRSWQNRRLGLRIKNSPEERAFFEFAASCGALRSYILERECRPCAFMLGIQWKGRFTHLDSGYDEADAKCGPGIVLLFRALEDFIAHDTPRSVDFGPGDYDYKQLFGDRHTYSGRVLVVRRSWGPMVASGLDHFRREAQQGLRDYLKYIGIFNRLKHIYHRMPNFIKF